LTSCVKSVAGDDTLVDKLIALGVISVLDLEDVGAEPLISELGIDAGLTEKLIATASEEAKRLAAEPKKQAESVLEQQGDRQRDESAFGGEVKAPDNEQQRIAD